jgi:hypothetical protein
MHSALAVLGRPPPLIELFEELYADSQVAVHEARTAEFFAPSYRDSPSCLSLHTAD